MHKMQLKYNLATKIAACQQLFGIGYVLKYVWGDVTLWDVTRQCHQMTQGGEGGSIKMSFFRPFF